MKKNNILTKMILGINYNYFLEFDIKQISLFKNISGYFKSSSESNKLNNININIEKLFSRIGQKINA